MAYPIAHLIYGLPLTTEVSRKIDQWEELIYDSTDLIGKITNPEDLWYEDEKGMCGFEITYNGNSLQHEGWCGILLAKVNAIGHYKVPHIVVTKIQEKEALDKIMKLHPRLKELAGGDQNIGYHVVMGSS